jgi:feruloyl esterase
MQHCAGGPGPDDFGESGFGPADDPQHNIYRALEGWAERGAAPSTVIASKLEGGMPGAGSAPAGLAPKIKMTRLLCPYPQQAKYKGKGDPNEAASFTCENP